MLDDDEAFLPPNPICGQIKVVEIVQAQDSDGNVNHVKEIIRSQQIPTPQERQRETPEVK